MPEVDIEVEVVEAKGVVDVSREAGIQAEALGVKTRNLNGEAGVDDNSCFVTDK